MNKMLLFSLLVVTMASASFIYTVDTDYSGFSSVTLSIQGNDSVIVTLPSDASSFAIVGGSYTLANSSAFVSAGPTGFTTFSYDTSLFTSKTSSGWKLSFTAPQYASVLVYMPIYSDIDDSYPQAKTVSADTSNILLQYDNPGMVTIYYSLTQPPQSAVQGNQSQSYALIAVVIVVIVILVLIVLKWPSLSQSMKHSKDEAVANSKPNAVIEMERIPTLEMTNGKKEMMETFNENDLKIVNFLIGSNGKARRNELERKTEISKSSLAMALNRLEKRKIVEIDRTATTHFVKLSEYFLKL